MRDRILNDLYNIINSLDVLIELVDTYFSFKVFFVVYNLQPLLDLGLNPFFQLSKFNIDAMFQFIFL